MKRYYLKENTPLKYHKFVWYFSLPVSMIVYIGWFLLLGQYRDSLSWADAVDIAFYVVEFLLTLTAFIGFFQWKPYAWYAIIGIQWVSIAYFSLALVLTILILPEDTASAVGNLIGTGVVSVLVTIYYRKRRPLFFPTMIPAGYILERDEPKGKPCPHCGHVVSESSFQCSYCGYMPPNKVVQETPKVLFCRECGTKLLDGSMFCHKCGTSVVIQSQATTQNCAAPVAETAPQNIEVSVEHCDHAVQEVRADQKTKRPRKWPKRLVIAIALLVVALGLIWINRNYLVAAWFCDAEISEGEKVHLYLYDRKTLSLEVESFFTDTLDIEWSTSDEAVATVTSKGVIKATGKGEAVITVSINGVEKDSCEIVVGMKPVSVKNGQMIIKPRWISYPEVTVHAPKGENCFVYLRNVNDGSNSCGFYVSKGASVTVNVAPSTYEFFYATGDIWYGTELKFGSETGFYKDPDRFSMTVDEESYDIMEFTLYSVSNGNMQPELIDEGEFPV